MAKRRRPELTPGFDGGVFPSLTTGNVRNLQPGESRIFALNGTRPGVFAQRLGYRLVERRVLVIDVASRKLIEACLITRVDGL